MGSMPELWTVHLGVVPYREALDLQHRVRAARQADAVPDVLLLLEHPRDVHAGAAQRPGELARGEAWYRDQGIEVVGVDRGGKVTYHGPGQLVGYPIVRTDDVIAHVRTMEDVLIAALEREGVAARSRARGRPGLHGRLGGRPQDRLDRRARRPRRHHARLRGQRRQRPRPVHLGRRLRAARRDDDLGRARDGHGPGACPACARETAFRFAQAHGLRQRLVSTDRLHAALGAARVPAGPGPLGPPPPG